MRKIRVVIRKEWSEVFKNRLVLFAVAFMPLLFTILPLIILYSTRSAGSTEALGMSDMPASFNELCSGLNSAECTQYFIVTQFMILFMMMPVIIPVTIASYSIVGEKSTHTLEPVLATPISTLELLAGKALAAIIPALLATWLSFTVFVVGAYVITTNPVIVSKLLAPIWLLAILGLGPLLSLAGVSVAVMVSSRVNDPRVAEQISTLVILPLIGLMMAQTFGLIYLDETMIFWIAVAMIIIDTGLIYFAIQLFQRETILTRWK
jgi:ABC-2 type transport system permease protein